MQKEVGMTPETMRSTRVLRNFQAMRIVMVLQRYFFLVEFLGHGSDHFVSTLTLWEKFFSFTWFHIGTKMQSSRECENSTFTLVPFNFLHKSWPPCASAFCENCFLIVWFYVYKNVSLLKQRMLKMASSNFSTSGSIRTA